MMKRVFRTMASAFAFTLLSAAIAAAQGAPLPPPLPPEVGVFVDSIDVAGATFTEPAMRFENDTVTGAPYSAEAVTSVVQPLADGNRIVHESKADVARDSAGRTRSEQGLAMLGPMLNKPEAFREVQITDPEARTIIMLDMQHKVARKMPSPSVRVMMKMIRGQMTTTLETSAPPPPPPPPPPAPGVPAPEVFGPTLFYAAERTAVLGQPTIESLGKQFMEGVEAEGTRTTFTIPKGQIGNEQPLSIVSERWFSPALKVLVMSRQSDPRFGDTTYRLTNINRSEPSPALFEIPSDFTVEEGPRDFMFRKMTK